MFCSLTTKAPISDDRHLVYCVSCGANLDSDDYHLSISGICKKIETINLRSKVCWVIFQIKKNRSTILILTTIKHTTMYIFLHMCVCLYSLIFISQINYFYIINLA